MLNFSLHIILAGQFEYKRILAFDQANSGADVLTQIQSTAPNFNLILLLLIGLLLVSFLLWRKRIELQAEKAKSEQDAVTLEGLRDKIQNYEQAQAFSQIGSWILYPDSLKKPSWSPYMYELYRLDSQHGIPTLDQFLELIHPDDRSLLRKAYNRRIGVNVQVDTEYRSNPAHGPLRYFLSKGHGVFDSSGELMHVEGTVQDITEFKQIEEKLKINELLFEETGRLAKIGGWEFDPATLEGTWTPGVAQIHDLDPDVKASVALGLEVYEGEHLAKIEAAVQASIEFGTPYDFELVMTTVKGNKKWVRTVANPIVENGQVVKVRGYFQDITEFKEIEERLKINELLFEETGRLAKLGGWELDPITLKTAWTDAVAEIYDFDPAAEPNLTIGYAVFEGEHLAKIEAAVQDAIESGTPFDLELEMITVKGNKKWVRSVCNPILENGEVVKVRGYLQDITARKKIEQKLKLNEELLEATGRLAKIGGWEFDPVTLAGTWTETVAHICDLDPEVEPSLTMGLPIYEGEHLTKVVEALQAAVEFGTPFDLELVMTTVKGNKKWVRSVCNPILENGEVVTVQGYLQDITARKEVEQKLKLNEELLEATGRLAKIGGWEFDPVTLESTWTETATRLFELDPETKPSVAIANGVLEDEQLAKIKAAVQAAFKVGTPFDLELEITTVKGNKKWIRSVCNPNVEKGEVVTVRGYIQDITERKEAEELARMQERFISAVVDTSPAIVYVNDITTGRNIFANRSLLNQLGYHVEETREWSSNLSELVHPQDLEKFAQFNSQLAMAADDDVMEIEYRMRHADQSWRYFRSYERVFSRAENGTVKEKIGVATDITTNRLAEIALKEQEHFISTILDTIPLIIYVWDFETESYIYANSGFKRILGYEPKNLTDFGEEFLTPITAPEDFDSLGVFQAEMVTIEDNEVRRIEYGMQHADGNWLNMQSDERAFLWNVDGSLKQKIGVAIDITEQKQANEALKEQEHFISTILRSIPSIVYVWDLETEEYVYVNSGLQRILGYAPEDLMAQGREMLIPITNPEDFENLYMFQDKIAAIKDDEVLEIEYQILHADGHWVNLRTEERAFLRNADGSLKQKIAVAYDVSKHRALEKANHELAEQLYQIQKMESLGRLAGGIAHDFNNLLVPILVYTQLARLNLAPEEKLYTQLTQIESAAEKAAVLTNQILAFSRKQVLEMKTVNLNDIVAEFETLIQRIIQEDISVQIFLDPGLYKISADKGKIEQVMMNLVVNARDAMPDGGQLTIETANVYLDQAYLDKHADTQKAGYYAMLAVSDTGYGMDLETQQQIFEPFFSTKTAGKGTGLGLATVFGIVKQHLGNIWVYSEPGNGATFKIYLPRTENGTVEDEPVVVQPTSLHGNETILVVEDDDMVRSVIQETLETFGYTVLTAADPLIALEQIAAIDQPIDLLLTDVIMPHMNGRELYNEIIKTHPDIEVLYVSGYTDNVIIHHGILYEGIYFLQKPITVRSLTEKIRSILGPSPL